MLAYILAGGEKTEFTPQGKAFARIHGKQMVEYVIEALQGVSEIEHIVVINNQKSLLDNLREALQQPENPDEYILIATCDVPFLTADAVRDFLDRCNCEADFYYPIVGKEDQERRFPEIRRTYVKLKEGSFTGGNLFLVKPSKLIPLLGRVEKILDLRKSPLALSAELGFSFVLRMAFSKLTGMLTIRKVEDRVAELFQINARAVISPYPELANDIDRPEDLLLAENLLSG
ncbi:nucleotidyltransferase family protein [Effusibacillus lacus]|uniref:Molybdopterin-guanine dinucleotide biosynthesis protein A n=1 Tax=Effusibacillus lacus TaxID=1348429 RepID=A0A292YC19_9BACL|nr:nucleotidyltransferase family protein [Effusibacillus lacus]GAX88672.1 molybdopterin-guanine dinucleotide biosynthesis protein A [Effusibacillus lacus]